MYFVFILDISHGQTEFVEYILDENLYVGEDGKT